MGAIVSQQSTPLRSTGQTHIPLFVSQTPAPQQLRGQANCCSINAAPTVTEDCEEDVSVFFVYFFLSFSCTCGSRLKLDPPVVEDEEVSSVPPEVGDEGTVVASVAGGGGGSRGSVKTK